MMSNTLGAPFGGTTRGGHHGFDSLALWLITPPNLMGGGGSCLPSIVIVALGEPGVPLICWASASGERIVARRMPNDSAVAILIMPLLLDMMVDTGCAPLSVARSGPCRKRITTDRKSSTNQRGIRSRKSAEGLRHGRSPPNFRRAS